ncbi:t-SNARE coiled-coil homology domain-containing protein [Meloidogyne graminicola]|uniref:t-SNARE coiled-coil homology domain-containing protein n=1 Tax=Meloidogyne graminicola TaxID=189291 RepID=A0A8S9ZVU8_9BILA|nr:t-SNARE coiled-coil homology domain-containing protein [Meloidogyne graminicola]
MVKDRLIEFQRMAGLSRNIANKNQIVTSSLNNSFLQNGSTNDETISFLKLNSEDDIESFLELTQDIRRKMDEMTNCLNTIRELHCKILNEPGAHSRFTTEFNIKVENFVVLSRDVWNIVKKIQAENDRISSSKVTMANLMIRRNQEMTLRQGILKLTAGLHMAEEEMDEAIEGGNLFNTVSIMTAEKDKKLLFEDVKSRHEDIIKLEGSIRELHEMFQDLAMLVESQGEMADHIETNVLCAKELAYKALDNVKGAEAGKRRNIKLKIALAICIVFCIIFFFFMGTTIFCVYLPLLCQIKLMLFLNRINCLNLIFYKNFVNKNSIECLRSRLFYQSKKRGILENDILIGGFAEKNLSEMDRNDLNNYDAIINGNYMEWDLYYYLTGKKEAPSELISNPIFKNMILLIHLDLTDIIVSHISHFNFFQLKIDNILE